jgi:NADH dehydrogenase
MTSEAPNARPVTVILGAGFAGITAAKRLAGAATDLVVIDRRNHHLFQPLLYQVATSTLSPSDISVPIREMLSRRALAPRVLMDQVTGIDRPSRQVFTEAGNSIRYDYLIIATGAVYTYFGHSDWARHTLTLKTNADALALRHRVLQAFEDAERMVDREPKPLTFVIIGGGPTGVEMAGAFSELTRRSLKGQFSRIDPTKTRILLVEAADDILNAFPETLRAHARQRLDELEVELSLGRAVEDVLSDAVVIAGERIEADLIVWSAGIEATPAARWLGVAAGRGGRIDVDEHLRLPGEERIFVVGDLAASRDRDGHTLPALAPVAKQQGEHAARVIEAAISGKDLPAAFRYRDWGTMATIGRGSAVGVIGRLKLRGFLGWLTWGVVHILYLVGFRNRLAVMINWAWAIIVSRKSARIIVAEPVAAAQSAPRARLAPEQVVEPPLRQDEAAPSPR